MAKIDEIIHQTARLRIMSALTAQGRPGLDFSRLRRLLDLTDGNLGAHLRRLEAAGYARITKTFAGRRPRTVVEATSRGFDAFAEYVSALEEVLRGPVAPGGEGEEAP